MAVDLRSSSSSCVAPRIFVDATSGTVLSMRETAAFLIDHAGGVWNRMMGVASDIKDIDVTEETSLGVRAGCGESGALNEAFSDIMGATAENWLPETRNEGDNVLMGERVTRDGSAFRNLTDPSETLPNGTARAGVDLYGLMAHCVTPGFGNDYCNVHANSGIASKAFTLMALGGTHKRSGTTRSRSSPSARTLRPPPKCNYL